MTPRRSGRADRIVSSEYQIPNTEYPGENGSTGKSFDSLHSLRTSGRTLRLASLAQDKRAQGLTD